MSRASSCLVGLSALILFAGAAVSQPASPDQGAAPPGSNSNMGDGTGGGPAGSIGDPNGIGPGAAQPAPGSDTIVDPTPRAPASSKIDASLVKSCQAMPHDAMMTLAKCRALIRQHPELFNAEGASPPAN